MSYFAAKSLSCPFEEAVKRVEEGLAAEGFGVITRIDARALLKEKLGVEFRRYVILGACNPTLAFRMLESEEHIGLLLPCNVVLQEREEGRVEVAALEPVEALSFVDNPVVREVAALAQDKLHRFIEGV